jgi:CheY-like chemotaxis protein
LPPGLRVLLVEDDAEVREVVRGFLKDLQCQVTAVSGGEQALLLLGAHADFDVLLSDVALGAGMRGTRLAALAQERLAAGQLSLQGLIDAGVERDEIMAWPVPSEAEHWFANLNRPPDGSSS